jgi:hypothetical protein
MSSSQPRGGQERPVLPEVAFYYPGPLWRSGEWIKNLLLFFDGIALLVPEYMKERPELVDPVIATPLRERGLLHVLEPERLIDQAASERLAEAMTNIIASDVLEPLKEDKTAFHELSFSRLGSFGDRGLADMILQELKARNFARDTEDGVSIPMHPMVRMLILVLLAQILRPYGERLGLDLSPATDHTRLVDVLVEVLSLPNTPSSGRVVSFDVTTVGVDLSLEPMEEILRYRDDHKDEYRRYSRAVRQFVRELSAMNERDREGAFEDRARELEDIARGLRRTGRKAWKRWASFTLGMCGATWELVSGDVIGGAIMAGAAAASTQLGKGPEAGAYSYLFSAPRGYIL